MSNGSSTPPLKIIYYVLVAAMFGVVAYDLVTRDQNQWVTILLIVLIFASVFINRVLLKKDD